MRHTQQHLYSALAAAGRRLLGCAVGAVAAFVAICLHCTTLSANIIALAEEEQRVMDARRRKQHLATVASEVCFASLVFFFFCFFQNVSHQRDASSNSTKEVVQRYPLSVKICLLTI